VKDLYDYKKLLGELLGAAIAVVWISFAFLGPGNVIFLAVAISLTIIFGVLSGGLIGLSGNNVGFKELLGWLFGAAIAVVWICYAIIAPWNMVFLVVAISLTIIFGVLSGGFLKLSTKESANTK
jgi:hypothetical protein